MEIAAFICFEICEVSITVEKILEKIKRLREERGFTHGNMTPDVRIGQSAYSKTEKNPRITVQRLLQIATALEVDVKYFFEDDTENKSEVKEDAVEIGYATKEDVLELKMLIRSIKSEIASIKKDLIHKDIVKARKK